MSVEIKVVTSWIQALNSVNCLEHSFSFRLSLLSTTHLAYVLACTEHLEIARGYLSKRCWDELLGINSFLMMI